MSPTPDAPLIVVTGGPGGGKTTLLEKARLQFCRHVLVLPESATLLFRGGFWRRESTKAREAAQIAIFHVQRQLESIALDEQGAIAILCDRGTLDGEAYWPDPNKDDFWEQSHSDRSQELARYRTVIHLESPPMKDGYNHKNEFRIENPQQATQIDHRVRMAWRGHPNHFVVEAHHDFDFKAGQAFEILRREIPTCHHPACHST